MPSFEAIYERIQDELGTIEHWNMRHVLSRRAQLHGDRLYLHYLPDGRRFTFDQFHRCTAALADDFAAAGIGRSTHVGVLARNSPEVLASFFALAIMGAQSVPINTGAVGAQLRHFLGFTDCTALVLDEEYAAAFAAVQGELPQITRVFVVGDLARTLDIIGSTRIDVRPFPVLDPARPLPAAPVDMPFSEVACLLCTSGTTGPSKAILITHASACFWGAHGAQYRDYREGELEYVYLPLFHGNALLSSSMTAMMAGTSIALTVKLSVTRFWDDIRATRASRVTLIGVVATYLWSQPPSAKDQDHQLRYCSLAPPPPFIHEFLARFNVKTLGGFGLTDYCIASANLPDDPPEKIVSNGRPRNGIQVRIADELDRPLPAGEVGEILLRNEIPFAASPGYYKMPEQTLASRRNLWFHTGDSGYMDADGYLYFTDRKKDSMRRRGENISAFEVESIIDSHPAVQLSAVYAVPSEKTEDEVAASVLLKPGATLAARDLTDFCARNMSAFMVPRYVQFVDDLPLTPSQKVQKFKLREAAHQSLAGFWDRESEQ